MSDADLAALEGQFASWVEEALSLRFEVDPAGGYQLLLPPSESPPQVVLDSLIHVRQRLDRVEGILASVQRAVGRVARILSAKKFEFEGAWDEAVRSQRSRPARGSGDGFVAPRERYAEANLETLLVRRELHRLELLAQSGETALSTVRLCHRGLNSLREDHGMMLRAMGIGSRLES